MTIRSFTLVTLVMVMGSATGCGGMRNFFFGRGARCGLCSRAGAVGTAINPLAPPPNTVPVAPAAPLFNAPRCRLFGRNAAPTYAPPVAVAPMAPCQGVCQDGYAGGAYVDDCYSAGMAGDCGSPCGGQCGGSSYGGVQYDGGVVDPYLGSGVYDGGYTNGGVIQSDDFQPRTYESRRYSPGQYDAQGDRIISVDPLPPGSQILN
ncbi:hypothetical protein [Aporhodopirellula aestuarii]|uniref:Uncharacterized protein n=1 Tax=Aporhodopirellula aestuarii TaxID=2950107 RepID=A0ABT0UAL9_9BACT|nr:hypothetical protein [Aporhodopirellula aestuarii]MCM2374017.1 hypothetical protein [Aporhodopirellula aestuarii]